MYRMGIRLTSDVIETEIRLSHSHDKARGMSRKPGQGGGVFTDTDFKVASGVIGTGGRFTAHSNSSEGAQGGQPATKRWALIGAKYHITGARTSDSQGPYVFPKKKR